MTASARAVALCLVMFFATWLISPVASGMPERADSSPAARLGLGDVLRAVADAHPLLAAAAERARAAEGAEMAARGGFDPTLRLRGQYVPLGGYPNGRLDVEVRQPTPLWGLTAFGGWRLGLGSFAAYDYRAKTASGGELREPVDEERGLVPLGFHTARQTQKTEEHYAESD